jgi:hypothetical protein
MELRSLTPTNPHWDNAQWVDQWDRAFSQCIREEIQNTAVPLLQWRTSGRKTKDKPNGEDMSWWSIAGVDLSRTYETWREHNPSYKLWVTPDGEPGNELAFTVAFGSVPVKVIIDRVFVLGDQLVVFDLKSGKTMPEDTLQLAIYAAAIELKYGVRPNLGAYFANRKGAVVGVEDLTAFSTDMLTKMFSDFIAQTKTGLYLPNPGRQCTWCEVAPHCEWGRSVASTVWRNN